MKIISIKNLNIKIFTPLPLRACFDPDYLLGEFEGWPCPHIIKVIFFSCYFKNEVSSYFSFFFFLPKGRKYNSITKNASGHGHWGFLVILETI